MRPACHLARTRPSSGRCSAILSHQKHQDGPVENMVVFKALAEGKSTEDLAEISIAWRVPKAKRANVMEILGEFFGEAITKLLDTRCPFLLQYQLILLLPLSGLKSLPREGTVKEVYKKVSE